MLSGVDTEETLLTVQHGHVSLEVCSCYRYMEKGWISSGNIDGENEDNSLMVKTVIEWVQRLTSIAAEELFCCNENELYDTKSAIAANSHNNVLCF